MNDNHEIIILSIVVIIFTALFVNIPVRIKINPLNNVMSKINNNTVFESARINEILLIKLLMTYLIFIKTNINLKEFVIYVFFIEGLLLFTVNKASLFLHTILSITFFSILEKYYSDFQIK